MSISAIRLPYMKAEPPFPCATRYQFLPRTRPVTVTLAPRATRLVTAVSVDGPARRLAFLSAA